MDDSIGQVVELYKEHGWVHHLVSLLSTTSNTAIFIDLDFGIIRSLYSHPIMVESIVVVDTIFLIVVKRTEFGKIVRYKIVCIKGDQNRKTSKGNALGWWCQIFGIYSFTIIAKIACRWKIFQFDARHRLVANTFGSCWMSKQRLWRFATRRQITSDCNSCQCSKWILYQTGTRMKNISNSILFFWKHKTERLFWR